MKKILVINRRYSGLDEFRRNLKKENGDVPPIGQAPFSGSLFMDSWTLVMQQNLEAGDGPLILIEIDAEVAAQLAWRLNAYCPHPATLSPTSEHLHLAWVTDVDPRPMSDDVRFLLNGLLYQEYTKSQSLAAECQMTPDLGEKFLSQASKVREIAGELFRR